MHNDNISYYIPNLHNRDPLQQLGFNSYGFDLSDSGHDTDCSEGERGMVYAAFAGNEYAQDILWEAIGQRLGFLRWAEKLAFLGVDAEIIELLKGWDCCVRHHRETSQRLSR